MALLNTILETQEKMRNMTDRCLKIFDDKTECPPESTNYTTHVILVAIIAVLVGVIYHLMHSLRHARNTVRARLVCLTKLCDINYLIRARLDH